MAILQQSDFASGEYSFSIDNYSDLSVYIAKYEKEYLLKLLGSQLYDLFIADLSGTPEVPQTQLYKDIFDPFAKDEGSCIWISDGIKNMLKKFVYFHYTREHAYQRTKSGMVMDAGENSEKLGYKGFNAMDAYNSAVDDARNIQLFIEDDIPTYPAYNGQYFEYISYL